MTSIQRNEIPFLTVAELGRLIRSRAVSPVEATEAYLERDRQGRRAGELVHHGVP